MSRKNITRILAVASGKGGVGKTNISVNLGLALAKEGYHPCIFDADLGLANINILLAIEPEFTLENVISGERELDDIIIRDYNGIDIIPGSSGVEKVANLPKGDIDKLITSLGRLDTYDFLILDTSAGIANHVIAFCMAASEVLLVITPEPTSMTDAYSLLKVLILNNYKGEIKIIVNQCKDKNQAKNEYAKFYGVVKKFLNKKVSAAGILVSDPKVVESVKQQEPFYLKYPGSNAAKCMRFIVENIVLKEPAEELLQDMTSFWANCFKYLGGNLLIDNVNTDNVIKDDGFIFHEESNNTLIPDKENKKSVDKVEIHQPDNITDLMNKLISSIEKVSEEIHEINSHLKSGSNFSVSSEHKNIINNIGGISPGYSFDYEEYLQEKDGTMRGKNG
ncbi:MAG: MinD/ParA family protein [Deltaproteobacteria bacterium]|nr:MinD/ParA family protein [Deltaproteobacteria bacterium]